MPEAMREEDLAAVVQSRELAHDGEAPEGFEGSEAAEPLDEPIQGVRGGGRGLDSRGGGLVLPLNRVAARWLLRLEMGPQPLCGCRRPGSRGGHGPEAASRGPKIAEGLSIPSGKIARFVVRRLGGRARARPVPAQDFRLLAGCCRSESADCDQRRQ
jgi:hypothetical protein